jgi:hypothetical protein
MECLRGRVTFSVPLPLTGRSAPARASSTDRALSRVALRLWCEPIGRCSMSQFPLALQERRLRVRRRVQIVALLHCHRLCRSVLIADYSRDGLLLESTCAVAIGERATVTLLSGHRLPVQVIWVAGTHIGVRFFGTLQAGHPSMLALWEAIRKYEISRSSGRSGLKPKAL